MVSQCKHLGIELTKDLAATEDVKKVPNALNRNAGMLMRKFQSVRRDIKKRLYESLFLPIYGMNLWLSMKKATGTLKQMATT